MVQAEIDEVLGDRYATFEDIENMPELQKVIAETLRMWPAPPLFIRCALEEDTWPEGGTGIDGGCKLARANDLFISTYNMGPRRSCGRTRTFDPQRWDRPFDNPDVKGWAGYDPAKRTGVDT